MAEHPRQRLMAGDPITLIGALASVMLECAGSAQTWMREAVSGMDERVSRAGLLYKRAVFTGEAGPLAEADRELDAAEADLELRTGGQRRAEPHAEDHAADLPPLSTASQTTRHLCQHML